jgi:hypothetical protein
MPDSARFQNSEHK